MRLILNMSFSSWNETVFKTEIAAALGLKATNIDILQVLPGGSINVKRQRQASNSSLNVTFRLIDTPNPKEQMDKLVTLITSKSSVLASLNIISHTLLEISVTPKPNATDPSNSTSAPLEGSTNSTQGMTSTDLDTGALIGIIIGSVLGFFFIVICILFIYKAHKKQQNEAALDAANEEAQRERKVPATLAALEDGMPPAAQPGVAAATWDPMVEGTAAAPPPADPAASGDVELQMAPGAEAKSSKKEHKKSQCQFCGKDWDSSETCPVANRPHKVLHKEFKADKKAKKQAKLEEKRKRQEAGQVAEPEAKGEGDEEEDD